MEPALQAGPLRRPGAKGRLPVRPEAGQPVDLAPLEAAIGHRFADRALLVQALTHIGAASDRGGTYQRLEFLGDRVLGVAIASMLHAAFPQAEEGELSRRLADLVRRETCAEVAAAWGVEPFIRLGAGEKGVAALRQAILGDICESLIGAVYLDGGYDAALALVARSFETRLRNPVRPLRDPKTSLQEWAQARGLTTPIYIERGRSGPDHAPRFTVAVTIEGYADLEAKGPSKRIAEQTAAAGFIARERIVAGGT